MSTREIPQEVDAIIVPNDLWHQTNLILYEAANDLKDARLDRTNIQTVLRRMVEHNARLIEAPIEKTLEEVVGEVEASDTYILGSQTDNPYHVWFTLDVKGKIRIRYRPAKAPTR